MKSSFDAAIIGASVAGLSVALSLLKNDIKPIVFEKKEKIGVPVQCAEYVPALFLRMAPGIRENTAQNITRMKAYIIPTNSDAASFIVDAPGFILNRDKWEQFLAQKITDLGGKIFCGEKVIRIEKSVNFNNIITEKQTIETKFVVGADGPKSLTAKFLGLNEQKILPAVQWLVPLKKNVFDTMIMFDKKFRGGYGWLFPKGNVANLGIGAENLTPSMLENVAEFFSDYIIPQPISKTGGLIPIGGVREKISDGRIFLIGDAAGTTDPITGAGIANAYESGQIAGKIIAEATKSNIINNVKNLVIPYEREMRFLRSALTRASERRNNLLKNWNSNDEEFSETIRRAWNFK